MNTTHENQHKLVVTTIPRRLSEQIYCVILLQLVNQSFNVQKQKSLWKLPAVMVLHG